MLLRVHKKLSFSLSSYIKRNIEEYDCTAGKNSDRRAVQFYEHLDELLLLLPLLFLSSPFPLRDMYIFSRLE
jgi:hypothetical protein